MGAGYSPSRWVSNFTTIPGNKNDFTTYGCLAVAQLPEVVGATLRKSFLVVLFNRLIPSKFEI